MSTTELTADQLNAIVIIERVNSSLSVIGCMFIVVTFLSSRAFHKPINRLVFFASVGNIITNIATLISRSAIGNPGGALCQIQGFLIQMYSIFLFCYTYLGDLTYNLGLCVLTAFGHLPWHVMST
jgi:hypothetical protein